MRLPSGTWAPRRFRAVLEADENGEEYELDIELDERGHSRCRELVARGEVRSKINVALLLRYATAMAAGTAVSMPGGGGLQGASDEEALAAWQEQYGRRPSRRRDTPNLEGAAKVWKESGHDIGAVQDALHVSEQTAYRYIRDARFAGLLPRQDQDRAA